MNLASASTLPLPPATAELDAVALAHLRDLDPGGRTGLLGRVLATYHGSLQRLLEQLARARAGGDLAGVRMVVHTLKSSSASVGALRLSAMCAEIERQLREQPAALPQAPLDDLVHEAGRVAGQVQAMLAD